MKVPLLDLKSQYKSIAGEIQPAITEVVESQLFILGPKVRELESRIAEYSGSGFGVGVSSGSDALLVCLMGLGIGPGDEVVTTPFTFFSTAGSIARLNAKPVFVDIDPVTFNLDPGGLEAVLTPRTKAVIPVHLYGQCADMDPIMEICGRRGIPVIEDAAQSIGAQYKGRRAGSLGELGIFSFFPSKNLGGFGDGGMVVTSNGDLSERIKILRGHGGQPKYYHHKIGGNFRLDALQAAVLLVKLSHLDDWSMARKANAGEYDRMFLESGLTEKAGVVTPRPVYRASADTHDHIYNQYTLRVPHRDDLREYLTNQGIGTEIYYPLPLHLQRCFDYLGHRKGDFPESEKAAAEVISLPIYPESTRAQREYIVDRILEFYGKD
jgi:dTDP-4-amino-4,6-dideoxygalactose transaminase